jgi:hypothetical protein
MAAAIALRDDLDAATPRLLAHRTGAAGCSPAQNVHLMAKNKILSFEPASRLHERRQPMQQQFDHPQLLVG